MNEQIKVPHFLTLPSSGDAIIGFLTVAENSKLPFNIKRVYWTYAVMEDVIRGHHAHRELEQIIFAVHGEIEFTLEDISGVTSTYRLDNPSIGLYIPRLYWRTIKFSSDAVLMCLASLEYTELEYIRDYVEFRSLN